MANINSYRLGRTLDIENNHRDNNTTTSMHTPTSTELITNATGKHSA